MAFGVVGSSSLPADRVSSLVCSHREANGDAEQPSSIPGLLPWTLPKGPRNKRAPRDPKKTFTSAW